MTQRTLSTLAACALALMIIAAPASAATFQGRVVAVLDGDTIIVLAGRDQVRVRLARIDAPERPGQPYSVASRDALAAVVAGRTVRVSYDTIDRYGRPVGEVEVAGVNANTQQLRQGYAWVFRHYNRSPVDRALEAQARIRRSGLWADPQPTAPWEWRREKRER